LKPLEVLSDAISLISVAEAPFAAVVVVSARTIDPAEVESSDSLAPILESRVPVHVIAHRGSPVPSSSQGDADVLRDVSGLTRGQYTTIYTPVSYSIALDRLADRLATEMMIQFLVPPGSAGGGEVTVGVRKPGARVVGLGVSR
jgi:hypothetical protein